jgi:hypothetical protein
MRTTKISVLIDTTHTVHGCLEQGGIAGRVVAYPIDDACRVTGLTRAELAAAEPDDAAPAYACLSVRQAIEHNLSHKERVVRRGDVIE